MHTAQIWSHRLLSGVLSVQLFLSSILSAETSERGLLKLEQQKQQLEEFKEQRIALWVLSIGVSDYAESGLNLRFADHDAEKIAAAMATQKGILFDDVYTHVLVNENATRESIIQSMSSFLGQASQNDVILIFLAGHGVKDGMTDTYYFLPHNANTQNLLFAGLPMQTFEEMIKRLRNNVNKVMIWNDTCHAGAMQVAARGGLSAGEDLIQALKEAEGLYVLSASKSGEESLENASYLLEGEEQGHGAFTFTLLTGLQGAAANKNGVVWLSELFGHVNREVPKLTFGTQHPYSEISGSDMPLFVLDRPQEDAAAAPTPAPTPAPVPQDSETVLGPVTPVPVKQGGSKTWLWLLLGAAAAGGAGAVAVSGGGGSGGDSGSDGKVDTPAPEGGVIVRIEIP